MVRLEEYKLETENKAIEKMPSPGRAYIPLSQHIGRICSPEVKIGDTVLAGQKIAGVQANVSSPIHASISGKVISIQDWPHPFSGRCKSIIIDGERSDKAYPAIPKSQTEIENLTPEQIRNLVFEAGIVGMGGASFPTHIKLNPPKPVDTLIINGAECEPYLTGDYRLMVEKTKEILQGVGLVARCLGVEKVYIAIEDNKPEAIKEFTVHSSQFAVKVLKSAYPQGGEKQLIKNILNKEVPQAKLPFDIGVAVHNVATCFAIYEAVYKNKPLYERVVTVTGSCLSKPKNLLAKIGTPIKELIDFCTPLKEEPVKVIMGGPMMGIAQYTLDVPVIKSTTGVILLNKKEAALQEEEFCIRCGACVRECPVFLMPTLISLASQKELWPQAKIYGALDCIECGLCNYVCPANIRLVQHIKRAKLEAIK
ncbi:MAG: electron transport complex subunit RsxC [Candidatus Omnitrophica bacterium]|nr:electron transport complex subunit RsxC [Candidatus Omnitrophota bacterium]MDD5592732.1 electron transport complex subunit RsxC [Candidatus Omnitrophota bacterium]